MEMVSVAGWNVLFLAGRIAECINARSRRGTLMLELLLLYAHGLLAAASIGVVSFHYAQISLDYHLGVVAGTAIISMFSLCGALGGVFAGALLTRSRLRRTLAVGGALLAASSLLSAAAPGAAAFVATRLLASLGFIIIVTVVPVLFSRYSTRRRVLALSLWGAYLPLGIALGNGACALALWSGGLSWRPALAGHGGALLLLVLAGALGGALRRRRARPQAGTASQPDGDGAVASIAPARGVRLDRAAVLYAAGFGMFTAIFLIAAGVLPRTLVDIGGLSTAAAGVTSSFVLALGGLGSVAVMALLPRVRRTWLLLGLGFLGSALASIGLYALARRPPAVVGFAVSIIVVSSLIPATVFACLPRVVVHRDDVGALSGLLTQVGCVGSLVGPPLLGWWVQRFGYASGWVPFVSLCAVGFALFTPSIHRMSTASPP
jgi:MFS family permease